MRLCWPMVCMVKPACQEMRFPGVMHGSLGPLLNLISLNPGSIPSCTVLLPTFSDRKKNGQSDIVNKEQNQDSNPDMTKAHLYGVLPGAGHHGNVGLQSPGGPCEAHIRIPVEQVREHASSDRCPGCLMEERQSLVSQRSRGGSCWWDARVFSGGCCNEELQAKQICSVSILEVRSLKARCWQGFASSGGSGENP